MRTFNVGERIGEYEILDQMAEGGMGIILCARHRLMKRVVAIKVAKLDTDNRDLMSQMFRREIEASARLTHPHVLTVFDAGINEGFPYLVTEYLSGGDLQARIENSGPCPIREAIDFAMQAAEGLDAIHQSGIIHRDVKPANLLIDDRGRVQVLDFGISRLMETGKGEDLDRGWSTPRSPAVDVQNVVPPAMVAGRTPHPMRYGVAITQFQTVIKGEHRKPLRGADVPATPDQVGADLSSPTDTTKRSIASDAAAVAGAEDVDERSPVRGDSTTQVGRAFIDEVFATDAARTIVWHGGNERTRPDSATQPLVRGDAERQTAPNDPTMPVGSRVGPAIGTPAFASPEQWSDPDRVDVRSDIYSLGCTLFFLLTGEPIVSGRSRDVMQRKMTGETRSPSSLRAEIPPGLDRVVARMTAVSPAARYGSMADVKTALEQVGVQPRVFISYRREDSLDATDRLYMSLGRTLDKDLLFMDVDSIPAGVDFREHIASAVAACDVLLAIIGDHWLQPVDDHGRRRIDDPSDFVRLEIQSALEQGLPLIPVLVGQARMPGAGDLPTELQPLAFKNAAELRAGPGYDTAAQRLAQEILSIWRSVGS